MKGVNKQELKYIVFAGIFSFVLFVLIIPKILPSIEGISPVVQFLIFNVGLFIFLQIFLKSIAIEKKIKFGYSLGIVLLFIAIDVMLPPFLVNSDGTLQTGVTLYASSSDYMLGLLAQGIGLTGFIVYLFVYVILPLILLVISSLLLKNFVEAL